MKKEDTERKDRAWFLQQEIDKMKRIREDEVQDEHKDWKQKGR